MSQDNVEIVRRIYAGWTRGDYQVEASVFDPHVEYRQDFGPDFVEVRGSPAMARTWGEYLRQWDSLAHGEIDELIDEGDTVVAVSPLRGRGKQSQVTVEVSDAAVAFVFLDSRIVRVVATDNRRKTLEAVGLLE
ncbi:MAG: nuclear transport factor 2 family protein [Thermoleophilaceae bacterium]|nr:nuclear transport factor 2 family protein [Thermoleophilaceae bacterium]